MITTSSPIVGNGGTLEEALAALDTPDATDAEYVGTLFRLCAETGLDYRIAFGQWAVETANGTSPRWLTNRNPAGLAVVTDNDPDPAKWDGTDAATAHVWALLRATATLARQDFELPMTGQRFFDRWSLKFRDPNCPKVVTVADLCRHYTDASGEQQSTWAWDETYADQIAAKANAIFKEEPVTEASVTFGNVPHPPFVDRLIPDDENGAWDDLGALDILGAVHHTMVGSLMGTDNWFRRGPNPKAGGSDGLTNYGIGGSTDGELDGVLIRWNDPTGAAHDVNYPAFGGNADHNGHVSANRAGWASGGVDGQEGDGPPFVARYGANAVNTKLVSIERSDGGNTSTPPSHRQNETAAFITAWVFDRAKVRYDSFPVNQNVGLVTDFFHYEFALKGCPDPVYKAAYVDTVQPRVRELLQAWQTNTALATPLLVTYPPGYTGPQIVQPGGTVVPTPPPTPEPTVPTVPWKRGDVGHKRIGTVPALAYVIEVTASKDAPVRVAASAKKDVEVIATIPAGKTGVAIGGFISGGRKWLAIDCGPKGVGRALASSFHEVVPMP